MRRLDFVVVVVRVPYGSWEEEEEPVVKEWNSLDGRVGRATGRRRWKDGDGEYFARREGNEMWPRM